MKISKTRDPFANEPKPGRCDVERDLDCGRCNGVGTVKIGLGLSNIIITCPECGGKTDWTETDEVGAVTAHETKR